MGPLLSIITLRLLANVYGLPLLCASSAYFHAVTMGPGHKVLERSIPWTMRPHQCFPTLDSIQGVGYFQGTHRLRDEVYCSSGTHRSGTNWHCIIISLLLPYQAPVPETSIYVVYLALFVYQLSEA